MKLLFKTLLAAIVVAGMAFRCEHKDEATITQTVEKTIKPGASFTVSLPGDPDDVYAITQAAKLASASAVSAHTYSYTATSTATGTDQIVLTATEVHQGHGGGHGGGHCGDGNETAAVVTVNVHFVTDSVTTDTRLGK
jgi:hypothetical protein